MPPRVGIGTGSLTPILTRRIGAAAAPVSVPSAGHGQFPASPGSQQPGPVCHLGIALAAISQAGLFFRFAWKRLLLVNQCDRAHIQNLILSCFVSSRTSFSQVVA